MTEGTLQAYGVIMAGGKGERFWPLSTGKVPKPFLPLIGSKTLIQLTVERVSRFIPEDRILIVLGRNHLSVARKQLPGLPSENFIVEPVGRDTAACIGLAATVLAIRNPKAIMVVLPADQYVTDIGAFAKTAKMCITAASKGDYLVTMGITPSRPETGYGYIREGNEIQIDKKLRCLKVDRFVEKPVRAKAVQYLKAGGYYWNAGIFVWQIQSILKAIRKHMPSLADGLQAVGTALRENKQRAVDVLFRSFERKSIDYGVMEKADNVLMVPAGFTWDDIGTWASLQRVFELDAQENYTRGENVLVDTNNSIIFGDDRKIGVIGLSDIVVVASKGGILVCNKERVQEVREIAKKLQK